ncbi:MAG: (2Fe-2S) ferredoxin domain-containing protein [Anaerolineales bacterium]|jgi:NADP-reducing hydrogenase subunit HndB
MSPINSIAALNQLREEVLEKRKKVAGKAQISVAMGSCGIAAGARETLKAILNEIEAENLSGIKVNQTGCIGLCEEEPLVQVTIGDQPKVVYGHVSPEVARRIVKDHIATGKVVSTNKIEA